MASVAGLLMTGPVRLGASPRQARRFLGLIAAGSSISGVRFTPAATHLTNRGRRLFRIDLGRGWVLAPGLAAAVEEKR
jgi:hypothetical protein